MRNDSGNPFSCRRRSAGTTRRHLEKGGYDLYGMYRNRIGAENRVE